MIRLCFLLYRKQISANNLHKDLERISKWVTQWKMNFNSDTTKQVQEVIFLVANKKKKVHPPLLFNPLSAKLIKWSNTLKQIVDKLATICLSVFDHFSGLALKGLIMLVLLRYPPKNTWELYLTIT